MCVCVCRKTGGGELQPGRHNTNLHNCRAFGDDGVPFRAPVRTFLQHRSIACSAAAHIGEITTDGLREAKHEALEQPRSR